MTALDLVGALDRCPTFDAPLTAEAVRYASPSPTRPRFVRELLALLPPGELRAAWERHLPERGGGPPAGRRRRRSPMAGGSYRARVDDALAATGARADPADAGPELVLGWEPGHGAAAPAGRHPPRRAGRASRRTRSRTMPWVVADLADQFQRNDPWPATVAERADRLWGPGLCYLAGIGWGDPTAPVLGRRRRSAGCSTRRASGCGGARTARSTRSGWSRASSTAASRSR